MTEDVRGTIAFIGVGSNVGSPGGHCLEAVRSMADLPGLKVLRRSSLYRTEPVGPVAQDWFVNLVTEVRTVLAPQALLDALKKIEAAMGREGRGPRWGPRVIDLDILLYGQAVISAEGLKIPHPEMHRRRFVLEPLQEIASYAIHPAFGVSIRGLLNRLTDESRVVLIEE